MEKKYHFYKGQKVVCIDDSGGQGFSEWGDSRPVAGEIYTVRSKGIGTHPLTGYRGPGIHLEEIHNLVGEDCEEILFDRRRFIPLRKWRSLSKEKVAELVP